ncbi:hypothetical protein SGPA1_40839 [Streptomyces misionensis JCM 4497]
MRALSRTTVPGRRRSDEADRRTHRRRGPDRARPGSFPVTRHHGPAGPVRGPFHGRDRPVRRGRGPAGHPA